MGKYKFKLYHLDIKYVRDLSAVDDKVMSISPQTHKEKRPFVGIVVICDEKPYCIPLSSPKPKHRQMNNDVDFSKIIDKNGKLLGVLNFNSMIPVDKALITVVDVDAKENDTPKDKYYKGLLKDQLFWCNDNRDNIIKKANKLYNIVTKTPDKFKNLTRRCCDFRKLEDVLEKRISKDK